MDKITPIFTSQINTPLGAMLIGATDAGVCLLEFADRRTLETELRDLRRLLKAEVISGINQHTQQTEKELTEYFAGQRTTFTLTINAPGTDFQRSVWDMLLTVPYGQTASYQAQASKLGKLKAIRAVAAANGANRISILIPCHRIIGKDGALTGYGGGLERKRWLLQHERNHRGLS